jgi:hypothetical protein
VDTLCALEVAVHPEHRRGGLSGIVFGALRDNARRLGFPRLVVPVRPPGKAAEPFTSMAAYAARTREDGLPADPWLRVHVRLGGRIVGVAPCSGTVSAPLARWREWTGLPLDEAGEVAVPGGLAPVMVSTGQDLGVYVEANVWVQHDLYP